MKIATRISLMLVLIVLACAGVGVALTVNAIRDQFKQTAGDQLSTLVSLTAAEFDERVRERQAALAVVADGFPEAALRSPEAAQRYLEGRPVVRVLFDDLLFVDLRGRAVADAPVVPGRRGTDYAFRDWFVETMKTGRPTISKPALGKVTHTPVISLTHLVKAADGTPFGMLVGALRPLAPNFLGNVNDMPVGRSGYFYIASPDRVFVAHRDRERVMQALPSPGINPALDRALAGFEGTLEGRNSRGLHGLFSFRRMQTTGWVIAAVLPADEAFAAVDTLTRNIVIGLLVLIAVFVAVLRLSLGAMLQPMRRLAERMHAITQGQSVADVATLPVARADEVGTLTEGFNRMLGEIQKRSAQLRDSERELQEITSSLGHGVYVIDQQGCIRFFNPAAERLLKWSREEAIGRNGHALFHSRRPDGSPYPSEDCPIDRVLTTGRRSGATHEVFFDRDGQPLDVELVVSPIVRDGEVAFAVAAFQDIGERLRTARQIEHMALHDALTGLPNRSLLTDRISRAAAEIARDGGLAALMMVDLDGFKRVNDTHGHDAGDEVLRQSAQRLLACVRGADTVARVGGDEFIVLLREVRNADDAGAVAGKIVERLAPVIICDGAACRVTASIGIALLPLHGSDPEALMKEADAAMYAAKQAGKSCWRLAPGPADARAA